MSEIPWEDLEVQKSSEVSPKILNSQERLEETLDMFHGLNLFLKVTNQLGLTWDQFLDATNQPESCEISPCSKIEPKVTQGGRVGQNLQNNL